MYGCLKDLYVEQSYVLWQQRLKTDLIMKNAERRQCTLEVQWLLLGGRTLIGVLIVMLQKLGTGHESVADAYET